MKKDKPLLIVVGAFVFALIAAVIEVKKFTGIPAHPLLLHAPVILVPALALATVVLQIKPEWRREYGIALGLGAMLTSAATSLTANSGEAWQEMLDQRDQLQIHDHAELGDKLKALVILFAVLILIQLLLERGALGSLSERFSDPRAALPMALSTLLVIVALGAAVLTFLTGHEGAKVVFGHEDGAPSALREPGGG
jgi:hypothetical protein